MSEQSAAPAAQPPVGDAAESKNLQWNKANWDNPDRWVEEWKEGYAWGGREVVERDYLRFVAPFLPVNRKARVLEIGCGMGRFTEFLLKDAERVDAVDLAQHCVDSCNEKFTERFRAVLTDGKSLPQGRWDLITSYASLVHADISVLSAYFEQAEERLVPGGFIAIDHPACFSHEESRPDVTPEMMFDVVDRLPHLEMVAQTLFRFKHGRFGCCVTVARRV